MAGNEDSAEQAGIVLNRGTLFPASVVVALMLSMGSGYAYLENRFTGQRDLQRDGNQILRDQLRDTEFKIKALEQKLDAFFQDRWTGTDQKLWAGEFQRQNPNLNVPKVR